MRHLNLKAPVHFSGIPCGTYIIFGQNCVPNSMYVCINLNARGKWLNLFHYPLDNICETFSTTILKIFVCVIGVWKYFYPVVNFLLGEWFQDGVTTKNSCLAGKSAEEGGGSNLIHREHFIFRYVNYMGGKRKFYYEDYIYVERDNVYIEPSHAETDKY